MKYQETNKTNYIQTTKHFKDYEEKCKKLTSEYENKYGPLSVSEVNSTKEFTWVNNWPWEVKNV